MKHSKDKISLVFAERARSASNLFDSKLQGKKIFMEYQ